MADPFLSRELQKTAEALADAAEDLFGFSAVLGDASGASVSHALLEGWEQGWFNWDDGFPRHSESRAKFHRALWEEWRHRDQSIPVGEGIFFQLRPELRAALFLRHKRRFSASSIGFVLGVSESQVRDILLEGRTQLLGRAPAEVEEF